MTVTTQNGWTPLNLASLNGHVDVVKLLLDNKVMAEAKDSNFGRTPLSLAATEGTRPSYGCCSRTALSSSRKMIVEVGLYCQELQRMGKK